MSAPAPYLSIIVTSRNDNHGGTLTRRMQTFVNALVSQCQRFDLRAELLIVEWNPPADRPPLVDALHWPDDLGPLDIRIIEVPRHLHAQYRHARDLPLFQMIAKNIGLRRARGRFLLCTNIDILFNDELMAFLAEERLDPRCMYRIDRHDVMTDVPVDAPVEEQLAYCRSHPLRVNTRYGILRLSPEGLFLPEPEDVVRAEDGFFPAEGWFQVEKWQGRTQRWLRNDAMLVVRAPEGPVRPVQLTIESGSALDFRSFRLEVYDEEGQVVAAGPVGVGRQDVRLDLPLRPGTLQRFRLHVPGGDRADADGWTRTLLLCRCGWPTDDAPSLALPGEAFNFTVIGERPGPGVATDDGFWLGSGWYPLHYWENLPVHWASPDCVLVVRPPAGPPRSLRLLIEAGPSVHSHSFTLEARDLEGQLLARGRVLGRQEVELRLDLPAGQPFHLRLCVPEEGRPDPQDGWLRMFRLFGLAWAEADASDALRRSDWLRFGVVASHLLEPHLQVAPTGIGFLLGGGWADPTQTLGHAAHWAGVDALALIRAPEGPPRPIRLLIEAGDAVGYRAFDLEVHDAAGRLVARGRVPGGRPEWIELRLPVESDRHQWFAFHVVHGGGAGDPEGITRAFRLYHVRWVAAGGSEIDRLPGWLNFGVVAERPAEEMDSLDAGLRLGQGWYPLHYWEGQPIHWASGEAGLVLRPPFDDAALRLVLHPGSAAGFRPFGLEVRDEAGNVLTAQTIHAEQPLTIPPLTRAGRTVRVRLRLTTPVAGDVDGWTRVYRLVRFEWVHAGVQERQPWPRLLLDAWRRLGRRERAPDAAGDELFRLDPVPHALPPAPPVGPERAVVPRPPSGPPMAPRPDRSDVRPLPLLHTNACGDFTLLAREAWFDLRAHPEWHVFSLHIDSIMCFVAHFGGLIEEVLPAPMCIYHIEHSTGSGWTPEGEKLLTERLGEKGIPMLAWAQVQGWFHDMHRLRCPMIFNGPDSALADEDLPETVVGLPRSGLRAA